MTVRNDQERAIGKGRGRKPVSLVAASAQGKLTGREAIWSQIREQREFTRESLWLALDHDQGDNRKAIDSYLTCLKNGGYIDITRERWINQDDNDQRQGGGGTREYVYTLIRDCGVEAPRLRKDGSEVTQGRNRENMWRAMRIIGEFNFHELAMAASTEEVPIKPTDAKNYIHYLHKAKYLVKTRPATRGRRAVAARYRLVPARYTGPKPPQIQRVRQVFDPNTNTVVWSAEAGETTDSFA
ncbi:hypothetical protein [Marinobacterium litorale]|uniref:hypothetical protein n=1 Tax=Marinobacterium litorale TaxID=404770 RepID=UPI0004165F98|nr:hypothetical protein [Marinobacterium litorale]